jgi:hypothetical protein
MELDMSPLLLTMIGSSFTRSVKKLSVPSTSIVGTTDQVCKPKNQSMMKARTLPMLFVTLFTRLKLAKQVSDEPVQK